MIAMFFATGARYVSIQFQDWLFLPFLLVSYAVFLAVKGTRFRNLWIVIISYAFYGAMNPLYVALLTYAILADYFLTWLMAGSKRPKLWLILSLVSDIGLLGFFKYSRFAVTNLNLLLDEAGVAYQIPMPGLLLPVGLSFYLFKSIGYVMDCYRGKVEREKNLITYAAFVSFFPLLVAGPIERAGNLLAQLRRQTRLCRQDVADGVSLFVTGLFKKVLADGLAIYVKAVYDAPDQFDAPALILATIAFAWQLYFDFSGYSDMARGVARLFGFEIILNFNHPYLATGLGDFWRRWHISLSTWFRDYLYIPLGGNRKGPIRTYFNLIVTFVVSGLWHGASWPFIIWGAIHGGGIAVTRALERSAFYSNKVPAFVKRMICFLLVCLAWVFFKATSWDQACLILKRMVTTPWTDPRFPWIVAAIIAVVWTYEYLYESPARRYVEARAVRVTMMIGMALGIAFLAGSGQAFAYAAF